MTSNRMFYIGLGCVLSTLFWTLTSVVVSQTQPIYPYKDKKEILQVDHLICSEFSLVNKDDTEVIGMFNMPERGHVIVIKDLRDASADKDFKGHLTLYGNGLGVFNSNSREIIGLRNIEDGGAFWARNAKGEPTWIVDGNSRKPIQLQQPSPKK